MNRASRCGQDIAESRMRINDIDLQLVVAIARNGSITEAASACCLAPSSASLRLRNLEDALGVRLFDRTAQGVFPTDAGTVMVAHANRCIQVLSMMRSALSEHRAGLRSNIQLSVSEMVIGPALTRDIGAFLGDERSARVSVQEAVDADIPLAVLEGKADLGITTCRTELPDLLCLPYRRAQYLLISANTPDGMAAPQWPAALAAPLVTLRSAPALRRHLHEEAARIGKRLDVRLEVDSHDCLIDMVRQGVGAGVLPTAALAGHSTAGLLRQAIPTGWASAMFYVCASAHAEHTHQLARRLLEALHRAPSLPMPDATTPPVRSGARVFPNPGT
ncbi:LysR family transcriptional regulator [Ideonella margarita]|uniref:LysR family transcriptional regulator n=1 Tax=Ideonella margarita TaxID=2984191 RepID=A0ABU9C7D2_9BURK